MSSTLMEQLLRCICVSCVFFLFLKLITYTTWRASMAGIAFAASLSAVRMASKTQIWAFRSRVHNMCVCSSETGTGAVSVRCSEYFQHHIWEQCPLTVVLS